MEQMDTLVGQGFQNIFKPKGDEKPIIPDTSELQKQLAQSQTEYDNTLRKALTTKSEEKKGAKKLAQDLAESKEKLERVTKHFIVKVDKIEDALRLKVLE